MGIKVVKPRRLGALYRSYRQGGSYFLAVGVLALFPLSRPRALGDEQRLWSVVPAELGDTPLDLGLPKPRGEVLLVGACRLPAPQPQARVSLRLGELAKSIVVFGDRHWTRSRDHFDRLVGRGWRASPPRPFQEMPLDWAHAFGGPHYPYNPLGKGHHRPEDGPPQEGAPLPNLELPQQMVANPWSTPQPAGLGPVPVDWPQRARACGTFDRRWLQEEFPGLPRDADPGLYNAAPPDQQREGFWSGEEEFLLEGVDPDRPRLRGRLPGLRARCFLNRHPREPRLQELPLALETVWFFPRAGVGVLLWRGTAPVESWDAKEVRHILVACELMEGARRSPADYQRSLQRRLDRTQARYWLLRQDDLLPPEGLEEDQSQEVPPRAGPAPPTPPPEAQERARDLQEEARQRLAQAEGKIAQARRQAAERLRRLGLDPAQHLPPEPQATPPPQDIPAPPPPPPAVRGPEDLPALMEYLQREIPRLQGLARRPPPRSAPLEEEARSLRRQAEQRLRRMGRRLGVELESRLSPAAPASAPDPSQVLGRARDRLEQLARQAPPAAREELAPAGGRLAGLGPRLEEKPAPQAPPASPPGEFPRRLPPLQQQALRTGGHYLPPPDLPPEQRRQAGRVLQERLAAGQSLRGLDLSGAELQGCDLRGADLQGVILVGADLRGADLRRAELSRAVLAGARLQGARLAGACLAGANLGRAGLEEADLAGCDLRGAVLEEARLERARLEEAVLEESKLIKVQAPGADFRRVRAEKAVFLEAELGGACFAQARLGGARFFRCGLEEADFQGAHMPKTVLVEVRGRGACFRGACLERVRVAMGCCFAGGDFRGVESPAGNWRECDLEGADFRQARLAEADFGRARLAGADFYRARARKARFDDCDLKGASLLAMDLMEGSLMAAHLEGADLRYANLFGVNFIACQADRHTRWEGADLNRSLLGILAREK